MPPSSAQELAVLQAVTYAALFDYPLTLRQLRDSLGVAVADEETILKWWRASTLLQAAIEYRDGLFIPAGGADLALTRARREAFSRQMLDRDRHVLAFLSRMPFVRMVALSGSLAHLNAEGVADLDLFVITSPNRVWCVTLTTLIVARLLGWRQRLCLNYVISERRMAIEPADLFSANQIIHLRAVFGHDLYVRFVEANAFVARYYPNFRPSAASGLRAPGSGLLERVLSMGMAQVAERVARAAYGWHLKRRSSTWRSRDQVRLEPECLKLHTSSHRADTLARFDAAMKTALSEGRPRSSRNQDREEREEPLAKTLESLVPFVV
ncbi:MAG: hypothetical protein A3J29_20840 [Acidobacteria bacterium RIFCSPLOWO2_12_FULL_67_14b]|nr:MAG: hypothetical protein A3J29_20840 [Acidobacteria bacterium RIFCSPLOWO2_12_FULL_67_14b]